MELKAAWIFVGDERDRKLRLAASRGRLGRLPRGGARAGPRANASARRCSGPATACRPGTRPSAPACPTIVAGLGAGRPRLHPPEVRRGDQGRAQRGRPARRAVLRGGAAVPGDARPPDRPRGRAGAAPRGRAPARPRSAGPGRHQPAPSAARSIRGRILKAVGDTARRLLTRIERSCCRLRPARLRVAHLAGLPHPELVEGQAVDLVALGSKLQLRALEERESSPSTTGRAIRERVAIWPRRWEAASRVVMPLIAHDRTLRAPGDHRRDDRGSGPTDEVDVAEALAAQASVALENARLYEEARKALPGAEGRPAAHHPDARRWRCSGPSPPASPTRCATR